MITDEQIDLAAQENVQCLADLDARGFLVGAEEDGPAYTARIGALRGRFEEMEKSLSETGLYEIEGLKFPADRRIPPELITNVSAVTREAYGFAIDWVPGFFADQSFGWLFGGCAYYFNPEFFAVFIIRKCFAKRNRWLIYNRDELLAHELCHVARSGLHANFFEEEFAYGLSNSGFRKTVGGLFRTGNEAFFILGAALLLLLVQIVRLFLWPALPMWPFWLLFAAILAYLVSRLYQLRKLIKTARRNLRPIAGENTGKVLFRCTDSDVLDIAGLADKDALRRWLQERRADNLRWKVIHHRFLGPPLT